MVAALAFDLLVLPAQRKARHVVLVRLKLRTLPALLVMAIVASVSEATFVHVVFRVALPTGILRSQKCRRTAAVLLGVAVLAVRLAVTALQHKTRDVVVELALRTARPTNQIVTAPAMFDVTMTTCIALEARAMKPFALCPLSTDVVVAHVAQLWVKPSTSRVALRAVIVGVPLRVDVSQVTWGKQLSPCG
jgi:hypothetical protein